MNELPPTKEIYSDLDDFVRAYTIEYNKRTPQYGKRTVRESFENLLKLTRDFDAGGQKGRISCGGVYVFPGNAPPQIGIYGAQTEGGAKISRFTQEELKALECP